MNRRTIRAFEFLVVWICALLVCRGLALAAPRVHAATLRALAWQGCWIILLLPIIFWGLRNWTLQTQRTVGLVSLFTGLLGLVAIAVWLAMTRELGAPISRFLSTIARLVQVPLIQLLAIGATLSFSGFRHRLPRSVFPVRAKSQRESEMDEGQNEFTW